MKQLSCVLILWILLKASTLQAQDTDPTQQYIDSLITVLDTMPHGCYYAAVCLEIANSYQLVDLEKGLKYMKIGVQEAQIDCPKDEIAYAYGILGGFLMLSGNYEESTLALDSGLVYYQAIQDTVGLATLYGYKANNYYNLGDYENSFSNLSKSIAFNEYINDKGSLANNYNTMAGLCESQKNFECCINYAQKGLETFLELEDLSGQGTASHNIAFCYRELNQLDSSLVYYNRAIDIYQAANNEIGVAFIYIKKAEIYKDQKKLDLALKELERFNENKKVAGIMGDELDAQLIIGTIYYEAKEYEKSINYLKKGLALTQELGHRRGEFVIAKRLAKSYAAINEYKLAYELEQDAAILQDSIWNENNQKQIKELEVKYETAKEKQEKELLAQELELEQLKTNYSIGIIIGLLITCLMLFLLFNRTRIKAANTALKLKYQLLRSQMNPHFIFNALSAIQSFIYTNKPLRAGDFLASFAHLVRTSLEHSTQEYIALSDEISWLNNYLEVQSLRFEDQFEYEIDISDDLEEEWVAIPPMLTQPFVENALEHGFKSIDYKGKLIIRFYKKANQLFIEVEDNGIGLLASANKVKDHASLATSITQKRLNFLNKKLLNQANLTIEEIQPSGTKVSFAIPYKEQT